MSRYRRKQRKWYVIWNGRKPGIYTTWLVCKEQIHGYPNARFKSYLSREEAEVAYQNKFSKTSKTVNKPAKKQKPLKARTFFSFNKKTHKTVQVPCPLCKGTGHELGENCRKCKGQANTEIWVGASDKIISHRAIKKRFDHKDYLEAYEARRQNDFARRMNMLTASKLQTKVHG